MFKALEKLICKKEVLGILISEQGGGSFFSKWPGGRCYDTISYRYRTEDIFFHILFSFKSLSL